MRRWILRLLAWLLGVGAVVVVLLAGAIRLDQYVLRWRGEHLLSDIRSLELRKSTYADARRLEDRWLDGAKEGVCRPSWCDLEISLGNMGRRHLEFLVNHPAASAIYHGLGGRIAGAGSFVHVRDNLLLEKGIGLGVEAAAVEPDGRYVQYELSGSIETAPFTWVSPRHPEYQIGGPSACTSCKEGWVKFTAFADPKDISRLTDINFACITRWHSCKEQADVLPSAWKELRAEESNAPKTVDGCTPPVIRVLSRESHRVVLANIIAVARHADETAVTVRRMPDGLPHDAEERQQNTYTILTPTGPRLGDQLLVFDNSVCYAAPATKENLIAARLGAAEAWVSPVHPVHSPFRSFAPPKIDVR